MRDEINYDISEGGIIVQPPNGTKQARAFWGMQRPLCRISSPASPKGFTKVLEITGVGYRATAQGKSLSCSSATATTSMSTCPEGIEVKTPDQPPVEVSGIDRQKVGQVAAEIRRWRKPEPYKGKGIKYRGEYIFRKEGKKK
jgi:large subunit ribosomal protein L6